MEENGKYIYYDYYNHSQDYVNYKNDNVNTTEVDAYSITISGFYIFYLVVSILTFLVGVLGNGLVIWITGLKMKKTVNTTWYLSLAVSDFIFCVVLPLFYIILIATDVCVRGLFTCNFPFELVFIPMFSSVFLLVIISVDHCVSVVFPVWAQNNHTINKVSVAVILAWVSSVALSTRYVFGGGMDKVKINFIGGFAVPFLIIFFCYCVTILRLRTRQLMNVSSKSLRVMTALIAMFFICWLPLHVFRLLLPNHIYYTPEVNLIGKLVGVTLATVHSFLRPVLYVCMGNNVPQTLKRSIVSRIENVLGEEDRPTTSHETSTHL
ncbi:C3a anaphylatoxin chemotactic receptor-like isoform X2 [Esox lucius]|uniref:G-protein coupled receptors family 1 profile domain-containing protein n=1 Tax=Esox lucius TaxID=8010 RepID=A0AAY5KRE9_ESOLU|nr:C3a anaphylatoxin chemotactic receptor-like isoform X2 [Esox lucius]